jgi:hypothetical protein
MDTKECSKCGEKKSTEDFAARKLSKDGLNAWCRECMSEYRRQNKERQHMLQAEWARRNPEKRKATERKSRKKHSMARREYNRQYHQRHPEKALAHCRKRQAAKLQRTPSWANEQLISAYYKEAKRLEELTGIQFHVDHIIPLQGEMVSGLHVETNLQLLPAHENIGKSNSFDPETFCA